MNNRKIAAIGILASIGASFLIGFFSTSIATTLYGQLITLCGLAMMVFGIWGAVLLLKE